jgi:hypothetical protein
VVRATDAAGMDELWLWEDCFSESRIALAAAGPVPAPDPRPSHESSAASGSANGTLQEHFVGVVRNTG